MSDDSATAPTSGPGSPTSRRSTGSKPSGTRPGRADGTYASTARPSRAEVFSIDTPPPTVSGIAAHGHVFGYTQTDAIARYQRMAGKAVFYPMGWDDNGLPTERRVQNYYGVRCDPSLPYDPDFTAGPRGKPGRRQVDGRSRSPRRNFVELCQRADHRGRAGLRGRCGARLGL